MSELARRNAKGQWYVQPYIGIDRRTGRKIRPYMSWPADTPPEVVEAEAREFVAAHRAAYGHGERLQLGPMMASYVDWCEEEGRPANTIRQYRTIVRRYLRNLYGHDPRKVEPAMLTRLYHDLLTRGGRNGGPLEGSTVRAVHWLLRKGWQWMVHTGVCTENPAVAAEVPRLGDGGAEWLDEDELRELAEVLDRELSTKPEDATAIRQRMHLFGAWMALHTGMRCGEVCAVRRCDVSTRYGAIRVTGTVVEAKPHPVRQDRTKSGRSRTVPVTADEMRVISEHIDWQESLLGAGDGRRPLVSVDGSPCRPSEVSRTFSQLARRLWPDGRKVFHSLRHTHSAYALMEGVDLKTLQERLGHAQPSTTLNLYGHTDPRHGAEAAEAFARAARGD